MEKEGPFDGILGFSQGACFVGLLCDLQQRNCKHFDIELTWCIINFNNFFVLVLKFKFDFAIMASGFKSGSLPHVKYYSELITIPTLHIFGENDDIIPTGK